jgi:hypothetical protein
MSVGGGLPFVKVLVSGGVVDVWTYEKMPAPSVKRSDDFAPKVSVDPLVNRARNQLRSKWEFMRTVNSTFNAGSRFITFTFADGVLKDVTDVVEANKYWDRFLHRLRRRYGSFQWAVVVEFQDKNGRGAVHYHMLANLPYIPKTELEEIWGGGFVWIEKIDHVDNVGAYVVKYMAAELADERLCGLKAWRTSRNVKKPLEFRGDDARDFLEGHMVVGRPVRSVSSYDSEYHGRIEYIQYNLNSEAETVD